MSCTEWAFIGISFSSGDEHLLWMLRHHYQKEKKRIHYGIYRGDDSGVQALQREGGEEIEICRHKLGETIDSFVLNAPLGCYFNMLK